MSYVVQTSDGLLSFSKINWLLKIVIWRQTAKAYCFHEQLFSDFLRVLKARFICWSLVILRHVSIASQSDPQNDLLPTQGSDLRTSSLTGPINFVELPNNSLSISILFPVDRKVKNKRRSDSPVYLYGHFLCIKMFECVDNFWAP